jgi:hypothetical protein
MHYDYTHTESWKKCHYNITKELTPGKQLTEPPRRMPFQFLRDVDSNSSYVIKKIAQQLDI